MSYGRLSLGDAASQRALAVFRQGGGLRREERPVRRRTTADLVSSEVSSLLASRLPLGWIHQSIPSAGAMEGGKGKALPSIIIISPAGRCYFLFAKAPADRWWDGDLRRVAAEPLTAAESALVTRLKRSGYGARPVWSTKDAVRVLASWGCKLRRMQATPAGKVCGSAGLARKTAARATLRLRFDKEITDDRR